MLVNFNNEQLAELCSDEKELLKTYGKQRAKKITTRIKTLEAAPTLDDVPREPPSRCHQHKGDRDETFTVDIEKQWRISFRPDHDEIPRKPDGGIDLKNITAITILDVCEDPH